MSNNLSRSGSILVVDDTVENLRLLSSLLSDHGYEVRPVTSGRQALQALDRAPPDLILLDVNMPEMNGYEACIRLQEMGHSDIPVIFLTALSDIADKVRAFDAGGVDYITKPFQVEEVLARVKVHLALRFARIEQAASYERLRQLEKLRDDLVNMIVHDMRSPLAALIGNLELIQFKAADSLSEQSHKEMRTAIAAASSLNLMANDLLDVSRLEAGQLPLDRRPANLTEIVEQAKTRVAGLDLTRAIEIDAGASIQSVCDARLIQRVIENLLSNAIKHTPEAGKIRIVVRLDGTRARVEVHDEGPGIPLEARERIFKKFGVVTERKRGTYHSSGLGLAFCKLAVEAHGGAIGVRDGDPLGSVFVFDLPA
jgi:two-component system, sensor histidine kinase and response regulator